MISYHYAKRDFLQILLFEGQWNVNETVPLSVFQFSRINETTLTSITIYEKLTIYTPGPGQFLPFRELFEKQFSCS